MEANLVYGPGDILGQPYRLRPDQKAFLYRAYELHPDGKRRWKRVIRGRPKGDAKTELAAAISLAEFAGPVVFDRWLPSGRPAARRRISPDIPCAAASYDQANLLWSALTSMVREGPLDEFIDVFEAEAQFKDGTVGSLYRVAAVAGTNDGRRPTFAALDETHEWVGNKKRVHLVLTNGLAKRADSWSLEITTAGARGLESVAEDSYDLHQAIQGGHVPEGDTLIDWLEADPELDLDEEDQLRTAIRQANVLPNEDALVARYRDPAVPHHEYRRYHLNQWVDTTGESWLDEYPGAWDALEGVVEFDPDLTGDHRPVMAIDWAQKRDGVAVVIAQLLEDGTIPLYARIWDLDGLRIDVAGALKWIREVAEVLPLRVIGYDPRYFELPAQDLEDDGLPMEEFPQTSPRMVPACTNALELIRDQRPVHNGDPVFARHVKAAVWRESEDGPRLSKTRSRGRIDGCISMVMALQLAVTPGEAKTPPAAAARSTQQGPITDFFRPKGRLAL